jgi:tetratricopeptide (TPR) repeat protein
MMLGMHGIKENRPAHLRTLDSIFVVLNGKRTLLTSYQRNYLDFLIAYREGDHYLGYFATKKMMEESPGSIDAVRECAYQAYRSRRPGEAAELLSGLNPDHPLIRNWTGFYYIRALFHHLAGEDRQALRVARIASFRTPTSSDQYGVIIRSKLIALASMGKTKKLRKYFGELENVPLFHIKGGEWYHFAARELGAHGKPEAAQYFHEKSHDWFESNIDTEISEPDSLNTYPYEQYLETLYYAGEHGKLKRICTRLARVDSSHTTVLMYLGLLAAREGNTELAREYSEKIESLKPEPILRHEYAFIWYKRARIAGACGDREEAMRLMRKAVNQGYRYWKFHYEIDFEDMRDYPPFQDFLRPLG